MEWIAIGLAFAAVIVLVRYASRPRCPLCARRHDRRVVVLVREPSFSEPVPAARELGAIRWRADAPVSLPGVRTDAASLN